MFLCNRFVFVHLPKTGGTFVRTLLSEFIPKDWDVAINPGHGTTKEIPETYKNLPVIGFIRNPWDYYVSWYNYFLTRHKQDPGIEPGSDLFLVASDSGRNDFKTTILNTLKNDVLRSLDIGGLSYLYLGMYGINLEQVYKPPHNTLIGKIEHIRSDLVRMLGDVGVEISAEFQNQIQSRPATNKFEHPYYREYYDDELRELIQYKDRIIISKYGYAF